MECFSSVASHIYRKNVAHKPKYMKWLVRFLQLCWFRVKLLSHCHRLALEFDWNQTQTISLIPKCEEPHWEFKKTTVYVKTALVWSKEEGVCGVLHLSCWSMNMFMWICLCHVTIVYGVMYFSLGGESSRLQSPAGVHVDLHLLL